jgi:hypothetical protein
MARAVHLSARLVIGFVHAKPVEPEGAAGQAIRPPLPQDPAKRT